MIESRRQYRTCSACRESICFADDAFSLEGRYSVGARRLAVLAGTSWSFDKASEHLQEFCGSVPDGRIELPLVVIPRSRWSLIFLSENMLFRSFGKQNQERSDCFAVYVVERKLGLR